LKFSRSEPGIVLSVAVHAGLLLAILFVYSDTVKFQDAQEYVPVDVVTDLQFNQIMKGEKTAREIKPPRVDKVESEAELKPKPPLAEAKRDIPAPPPPLKRLPDPEEDNPEPPIPPKRAATEPRPQPAPTPPEKQQAKASPEPEKIDPKEAEVVKPQPPERPKTEKQAEPTPKPEKPQPTPARKEEPRLKVDEVAKLLKDKKQTEKPDDKAEKSAKPAKPKSGDENAPKSKFNTASIAALLSHEAPQRQASTGRELTRTASLGAETANAPKMSPSLQAQIDSYKIEHYGKCWKQGLSMSSRTYVPRVEFRLTRDGELEGAPRLLNPSADPADRSRGEQALAAIRRCSPMPIPPAFAPYYDQWRETEFHMTEDM
jgi:TolA protein